MGRKQKLGLTSEDRETIERMVAVGREHVRVIRRANVLLLLDKGWKKKLIVEATTASTATIGRVKKAYREEGLDAALYEETRAGRGVTYGAEAKKKIVALACSAPPSGYSRWSLKLLAEYSGLSRQPSLNTVSLLLKEDGIKPWREKNVVRAGNRRGVRTPHA